MIKTIKIKINVKNHSMRKAILICQEILKFILIFLFFFIWIRYFVHKLSLAILITTLSSSVLYFLLSYLNRKRNNKNGLKIKEKEEAENMFLSLACSSNPIDFFEELAHKKHENIVKHKTYLTIFHPEKVKTILYAEMTFQSLTIAKFMEIYNKVKKENATKIVIVCFSVEKNVLTFCSNFKEKFLILDQYDTYQKLYKYYKTFPKITKKYNTIKKMAVKDLIASAFNKKKTKGYLFSAFVLILSSLFIPTTIYYCIIASLLIVFALISQFNPYFNIKDTPEIL